MQISKFSIQKLAIFTHSLESRQVLHTFSYIPSYRKVGHGLPWEWSRAPWHLSKRSFMMGSLLNIILTQTATILWAIGSLFGFLFRCHYDIYQLFIQLSPCSQLVVCTLHSSLHVKEEIQCSHNCNHDSVISDIQSVLQTWRYYET